MSAETLVDLNPAQNVYRHGMGGGGGTALVIDGRRFSYAELAAAGRSVAGWLRAVSGRVDDEPRRIGVLCGRTFGAFAGIVGAAWAGHTYVPLSPSLPAQRLALLMQRARLSALICDEAGASSLVGEVDAAAPAARLLGEPRGELPRVEAPVAVAPSHPAYVIFTSGTTGVPKGVVVTAANLAAFVSAMRAMYALGPRDRMSQCPDLTWDLSVFDLYVAWQAGASLHVVPERQRMSPARFIADERLTVWCSAPTVATMLNELKLLRPGAFPSLRVTMFCGEPLTRAAAKAWRQAAPESLVDNHFGPTEATCSCLSHRFDDDARITPARDIVAIGRPFPGMEAAVVDEAGSFVPGAGPGELVLAGDQVAAGYLDDPALTSRRFRALAEGSAPGRSRWYFTGDLVRRDEDGVFHHLGRVDNQVKVMGKRIELEEVEAHVRAASGCDLVAAVAWPLKNGLPLGIVAFVAAPVDAAALRDALLRRVPSYLVPRRIVEVSRLPTTANGKVDRAALLERLERGG